MSFDVMEDCIHLKACRRVQSIGRKHRLLVPRYCTNECTAYCGMEDVKHEIEEAVQWAFNRGKDGNDWLEVGSMDGLRDMLLGKGGDDE